MSTTDGAAQPDAAPPPHPRPARIDALDGLRGIAVAIVVAFHLGYLDGGYLGVDLFFVLSGYLITGQLLAGAGPRAPGALARFWRRRTRRIVPAQLALLVGVALFAALAADEAVRAQLRGDGVAALLGVINWHDLRSADTYWDLFTAPTPTTHLWSLAIELQLYLLWPLVVRVAHKRGGAGRVAGVAAGLAALSAAWAVVLHALGASVNRIYLGTDTRAAALLLGAAVAAWQVARAERAAPPIRTPAPLVLAAAAVLVGMWWALEGDRALLAQGGLALHSAAAAVVVLWAAQVRTGPGAAALTWRPLVALGVVSYGVYLWHWLVIVWADEARTGLEGPALLVLRLGLTAALAVGSWFLVERPVRHGVVSDRGLPVAAALASIAVLGAVLGTTWGADAPNRSFQQRPAAADDTRPRVLVVGDSLGVNLATALQRLDAASAVRITGEVYPGCTLAAEGTALVVRSDGGSERAQAGGCGPHPDAAGALRAGVERERPRQVLVVFALPDVHPHDLDGAVVHPCLDGGGAERAAQLEALLPEDPSVRVTFVTSPVPGVGAPGRLAATVVDADPEALEASIACHNEALGALAERHAAQVRVLDLAARVCTARPCPAGDVERRPDGVHLEGAALDDTARWLLAALE